MCFPITDRWWLVTSLLLSRPRQLGQNFFLAEDQVFLALDLDFAATVFAEEHAIANVDVERDALTLLQALAGARRR